MRPLTLALLLAAASLLSGCIGSDTPRAVVRGQALDKPYVPPPPVDLLVPGELLRSELELRQRRAAINRTMANPYSNGWKAADEDIVEHAKMDPDPRKR